MPFFSGGGLSNLVTCIVDRKGGSWEVSWVSEGKTPKDFSDASLSSAVEQAVRQIAALHAGKKQAENSELQFAIYPWEGNPGPVILDIATDGNGLTARDIQGTEITISGSSLEDLIQKGETMVPNPGEAMFRWIRRISELQQT